MFKSTKKRNEENLIKRLVVIESVAKDLSNKLKTSNAELKQSFEIFINDLGEYKTALSQGIESTDEVTNVIDTLETTLNYAKTLVTRGLTDKDAQKFQKAIAGMSKSLRGEEIQEVMVDDAERSMRGAFIVRQEKTIEQKLAEGMTEADMLALSIKLKGIEIIERENAQLKAKASELEKRAEALASENTHLYKAVEANQSLAKEFMAKHGEVQQDFDDLVETKAKDDEMSLFLLKKQSQVMEDNKRLQGNLDEENQRYLALDTESKAAIEAKKQAEESAAFAHKNLTAVSNDLTTNVKARQVAESDLALWSAQLQRNIEDLKQLTADIIDLAEVAEDLKEEKDKYYTEAQFGYIREKCDLLQRRRGELMERVHTAEKAAKQATLEVGYQDSVQRTHIQKLEAEINQLKGKTLSLQQECAQLKSGDVVIENEQLRAKLKAEREKKFSGVLEQFDNAAAAGVLVLEKKIGSRKRELKRLKHNLPRKVNRLYPFR